MEFIIILLKKRSYKSTYNIYQIFQFFYLYGLIVGINRRTFMTFCPMTTNRVNFIKWLHAFWSLKCFKLYDWFFNFQLLRCRIIRYWLHCQYGCWAAILVFYYRLLNVVDLASFDRDSEKLSYVRVRLGKDLILSQRGIELTRKVN